MHRLNLWPLQRPTDTGHPIIRNRKPVECCTNSRYERERERERERKRERFSAEDILSMEDLINTVALH